MIATISTDLDTTAERTWALVQRSATFLHVTRGILGLKDAERLPAQWQPGSVVRSRLLLFNIVPAWVHELRVVRVDDHARELYTNEHGGPLSKWNHRITVEPLSVSCCRYTDAVEIGAGLFTPLVWLNAHLFFRYRQHRLRQLVRTMGTPGG
jgi:hypothetical protein